MLISITAIECAFLVVQPVTVLVGVHSGLCMHSLGIRGRSVDRFLKCEGAWFGYVLRSVLAR